MSTKKKNQTQSMDNDQARNLWEKARPIYLSTLPSLEEKEQMDRYFSMISDIESNGDSLVFKTKNSMAAEIFNKNYSERIKGCLMLVGADPSINIIFTQDESFAERIFVPATEKKREETEKEKTDANEKQPAFVSTMALREEYTFDEFVMGPSNSYAYSAAKGVVSHPGEKGYNPLFIHGGTGLGKTHLMQAIGNELKRTKPQMAICYLTAEMFLNEYVNYMQTGKLPLFREKYRSVDLLLIDDVQFLQRGKVVQEEFFNTFQFLQEKNKQIVMTCDVSPKNLPQLESRLISRFIGGMVQEIDSPSFETRLAILKKKAEAYTPKIPDSALEFIAENIKSHVRAMEGALSKVRVMVSTVPGEQLSPLLLSQLLKDFIENEQTLKKLTIEEIQETVAEKFNMRRSDLISQDRSASVVTPRQLAMFISRKFTSNGLEMIGTKFDRKHATILHGVKSIQKRLDVEANLRIVLEEILAEFGLKLSDAKDI